MCTVRLLLLRGASSLLCPKEAILPSSFCSRCLLREVKVNERRRRSMIANQLEAGKAEPALGNGRAIYIYGSGNGIALESCTREGARLKVKFNLLIN